MERLTSVLTYLAIALAGVIICGYLFYLIFTDCQRKD